MGFGARVRSGDGPGLGSLGPQKHRRSTNRIHADDFAMKEREPCRGSRPASAEKIPSRIAVLGPADIAVVEDFSARRPPAHRPGGSRSGSHGRYRSTPAGHRRVSDHGCWREAAVRFVPIAHRRILHRLLTGGVFTIALSSRKVWMTFKQPQISAPSTAALMASRIREMRSRGFASCCFAAWKCSDAKLQCRAANASPGQPIDTAKRIAAVRIILESSVFHMPA